VTQSARATTPVITGDLYTEVLQFHSRQLYLLDEGLYDDAALREWADTFTDGGEYWVNSKSAPTRGRDNIYMAARTNDIAQQIIDADCMRRHLLTNLVVDPASDGTIRTVYYVALVDTKKVGATFVGPTTVVREILVRQGGALRTLSRRVIRDDLR
jgi:3-phenylpropionate/cinnamic acid dioxygenase small subunit